MIYPESQQIIDKINSVNKILLNCHHNPDADSVGSALAMNRYLRSLGKETKILSPSKLSKNLEFLLHHDEVIEEIDFNNFKFDDWELFITNDSSSWSRVSGSHEIEQPDIEFIVIDHHQTNQKYGSINLIIADEAANAQIIYKFMKDLGVETTPELAEPLLAGIIGDTGAFRFPEADEETFRIASELMKYASKNEIIFNLYQSFAESHVKVWKEVMHNLEIDKEKKFVYSFVDNDIMHANNYPDNAKAEISDMIFQSIEGTKFGMVGAQAKEGYMSVSFRARTEDADVAILASQLGGGGHKWAAAARIDEGSFDKNKAKTLKYAREFSLSLRTQ